MSEFKVSHRFNDEIKALESSKNGLTTSVSRPKTIPWLSASEKFYSEHVAISRMLEAYKLLLQKEVEDLRNMMSAVSETDDKLAETLESINNSY